MHHRIIDEKNMENAKRLFESREINSFEDATVKDIEQSCYYEGYEK